MSFVFLPSYVFVLFCLCFLPSGSPLSPRWHPSPQLQFRTSTRTTDFCGSTNSGNQPIKFLRWPFLLICLLSLTLLSSSLSSGRLATLSRHSPRWREHAGPIRPAGYQSQKDRDPVLSSGRNLENSQVSVSTSCPLTCRASFSLLLVVDFDGKK